MGCGNLAPRFEARLWLTFGRSYGSTPCFAPGLVFVAGSHQLLLLLIDLIGLSGRHCRQQPTGSIESPVGIIGGEGRTVRPVIANVLTLREQATLCLAKRLAEHVVPLLPHVFEKAVEVVLEKLRNLAVVFVEVGGCPHGPLSGVSSRHFALKVGI